LEGDPKNPFQHAVADLAARQMLLARHRICAVGEDTLKADGSMQANAGSPSASTDLQHDQTGAPPRPPQILRLKEVLAVVRVGRSAIYSMMAAGTFPKSMKLGPRAVGWLADDVVAWIAQRADRDPGSIRLSAGVSSAASNQALPGLPPRPEAKDRIQCILPRLEYEELQRLRALELRVRQMHQLQAEIAALLDRFTG